MMRTRRAAVAGSIMLALLGAACGNDGEDSAAPPQTTVAASQPAAGGDAASFANEVCTSTSSWQQELQGATAELTQLQASGTKLPPEETKVKVGEAFEQMASSTETFIGELSEIPVPPAEGAQEFLDTYIGLLEQVKAETDKLITNLESVPTGSAAEFKAGIDKLNQDFQAALGSLGDPFASLQGTEIQTEFENNEACQQVQGA